MLVLDNLAKLFFLLVALFAVHASAAPRPNAAATPVKRTLLTNAARMQAGLGPLKPRSMFTPSRISARTPTTSIIPTGGNIKVVRKSNGATVGYVSNNAGVIGFGITNSPSEKLSVTFTPTAPFNIAISGNKYPNLGFVGGDLGSIDIHNLVATNPTAPGSSPQNVGNTVLGKSESSVWSYNSATHALTAQWVNSSGPLPETHLWYYPLLNKLAIIRNPSFQLTGYEVLFTVV